MFSMEWMIRLRPRPNVPEFQGIGTCACCQSRPVLTCLLPTQLKCEASAEFWNIPIRTATRSFHRGFAKMEIRMGGPGFARRGLRI
jgi:hypothetical protein